MNAAACDALIHAARTGVPQITSTLFDAHGGRCAVGVIAEAAAPIRFAQIVRTRRDPFKQSEWAAIQVWAGSDPEEWGRIIGANILGFSFEEIASRFGPQGNAHVA